MLAGLPKLQNHFLNIKILVQEVSTEKHTLAETLQNDQSTYEPVGVVSFGPIRLEEVLADGRMIVEAHMNKRARIKNFTQEIPYYLAEVEEVVIRDGEPLLYFRGRYRAVEEDI